MNGKVLLLQNTVHHVETLLSIYESLKQIGYEPVIYRCYHPNAKDYGLKDLILKYNLNHIESYNSDMADEFVKVVIVTANDGSIPDSTKQPPANFNNIMLDFKDRAILIYHKADYSENLLYIKNYFEKPQCTSVCAFSTQHNLNFIYQCENPLISKMEPKNYVGGDELYLGITSRFWLNNRKTSLIDQFIHQHKGTHLNKKIVFYMLGEKLDPDLPQRRVCRVEEKGNIKIIYKHNIPEIEFYEDVNSMDFLVNPIMWDQRYYFRSRFTSTLHHTLAFEKPNISFIGCVLTYNFPSFSFNNERDFYRKIQEITSVDNKEYISIKQSFQTIKQNMRDHNRKIFNLLLSN